MLAVVILLFLLLGHTLAVAPGDEDDECPVPTDYPAINRVLLDSWRYQTLLSDDTTMSVWTTYNNDSNENGVWSSVGGTCADGIVAVCPGNFTKVLQTQVINKSLPAPDEYPVTVYVGLEYSILLCPNGSNCSFELQLMRTNGQTVDLGDNQLPHSPIYSIQFTASPNDLNQFQLSLVAHPSSGCIEVTRLLVYLTQCPRRRSTDRLALLPATQAPEIGSVSVTPQCVENSALNPMNSAQLQCTPDALWMNDDETLCVCNEGYYNDDGICRAVVVNPEMMVYHVNENQVTVELCFIQENVTNLMFQITTCDVTAINNFDYLYFPLGSTTINGRECISIMIYQDGLSEDEESFDVVVMRVDNDMIVSYATVYISRNIDSGSCTEGSVTAVSDAFNTIHPLVEMCSSEGVWSPVCDTSWTMQDATVVCRELGYTSLVSYSVLYPERSTNMTVNCDGSENRLSSCFSQITNAMPCSHLRVVCSDPIPTVMTSGSPTQSHIPTVTLNTPHSTDPRQTTTITPSNTPTVNNPSENDDSSIPIPVIAGLSAAIVISIIVILIVILLIVLLSKRNNRRLQSEKPSTTTESETCKDLSNPVYDSTTQGNISRSDTTDGSNKQEADNSPTLHNPLYSLPVHPTDNTSSRQQPLKGCYEDPEYSVPKGYETPVNTTAQTPSAQTPSPQPLPTHHVYDYATTSPSDSQAPSPQPPINVYDYAAVPSSSAHAALVPPSIAPEYAVVPSTNTEPLAATAEPATIAPEYAVLESNQGYAVLESKQDYAVLESDQNVYHYLESNESSSWQQQQHGIPDIYHSQGSDEEYSKLVHK